MAGKTGDFVVDYQLYVDHTRRYAGLSRGAHSKLVNMMFSAAVLHRGAPGTRSFSNFYPPVKNNSFVMAQNTMQINANFITVSVKVRELSRAVLPRVKYRGTRLRHNANVCS